MSVHVLLDSTASLEHQNRILNIYQKKMKCRVEHYSAADNSRNRAEFGFLPAGAPVPSLYLAAVPAGMTAADVQPSGTTLTFEQTVRAGSSEVVVAGFHDAPVSGSGFNPDSRLPGRH